MFSRRRTIQLWFVTAVSFFVWTYGAVLLAQYVRNIDAAGSLLMVGMTAILLFGAVLTFSIIMSSLTHLMVFAIRADDILREHGNLMYYLYWKELRDHIDNLQESNPK